MPKSTRRSILGFLGTAVLGTALPVKGASSSGLGLVPAAEDVRQSLLRLRSRIRTLDVQFRTETAQGNDEGDWFRDGENRLIFRRGSYKVTHIRDDVEFTEVLSGGRYIQHARSLTGERPPETLYDGPVQGQWHLGTSLQQFLPVPRDLPVVQDGTDLHHGAVCDRLLQGQQRFWVEQGFPRVVRLDVFADSSRFGEIIEFTAFRDVLPGVWFPMAVESRRFGLEGNEGRKLVVEVTKIDVNEFVPTNTFRVEE